jgi:hypothetical protein
MHPSAKSPSAPDGTARPRPAARAVWVALAIAFAAGAAGAGERVYLGATYAIGNDSIGQARDRWQSSQLLGSLFFGPRADAPRTLAPGRLLELRFSHQLITPESLDAPAPDDRPFAGAFGFEVLTHGQAGGADVTLGAGLVVTGPQTGTFDGQRWLHERLGYPLPATEGREVEDGVYPALVAEVGRSYGWGPRVRPFAEVRAGVEDLARAGVDVTWGDFGSEAVVIRDPVSGQRIPVLWGPREMGWSFTTGLDAAAVGWSAFLSDDGLTPEPRYRARGGVRWQGERWSFYYGATWLSPEFEGQREGQVVGILQVGASF